MFTTTFYAFAYYLHVCMLSSLSDNKPIKICRGCFSLLASNVHFFALMELLKYALRTYMHTREHMYTTERTPQHGRANHSFGIVLLVLQYNMYDTSSHLLLVPIHKHNMCFTLIRALKGLFVVPIHTKSQATFNSIQFILGRQKLKYSCSSSCSTKTLLPLVKAVNSYQASSSRATITLPRLIRLTYLPWLSFLYLHLSQLEPTSQQANKQSHYPTLSLD